MRKYSLSLNARKSHVNDEGIDGFDWNENQPKWPLVRIMNVSFGVISVVVWVLILFRIFAASNSSFEEMVLLNDKASEWYPEEKQVLRIHSSTDDAENGVLVEYPVYLEKAENFQLTARVNRRVISPGNGKLGYTFILRENSGDGSAFYQVSYYKSQKKFNYTFFRLAFEGVDFNKENSYTLFIYQGEVLSENGSYSSAEADFRFVVYTPDTYCKTITCKEDIFVKN
ncbi:MAG: hypothetical protein IKU24_00985 [Clostridia bacterium]|nr:hypothetical protein [Clostridia bacterium]